MQLGVTHTEFGGLCLDVVQDELTVRCAGLGLRPGPGLKHRRNDGLCSPRHSRRYVAMNREQAGFVALDMQHDVSIDAGIRQTPDLR